MVTKSQRSDASVAHKLREALDTAQCQARILRQRGYAVELSANADDNGERVLTAVISKTEHVEL